MMSTYINGSDEAIELYQKAFNAELGYTMPSTEEDCKYYHAELDIYGTTLAIAEAKYASKFYEVLPKEGFKLFSQTERIAGNTMQLCIYYDKGSTDEIKRAYEVLKEGSTAIVEIGPFADSPCFVDFIDKFGIRWCLAEDTE